MGDGVGGEGEGGGGEAGERLTPHALALELNLFSGSGHCLICGEVPKQAAVGYMHLQDDSGDM